ncbi:MAG: 3-hydroxyacyl-CoA dehydrogenase [Oscillospiraceae bacterium]|nr:3-hydroxyacyl-CoA dehydrogenase [Oscillospiraceae bacterium]
MRQSAEGQRVACLGVGVIGASWATNFALEGCEVALYDISQDSVDRAMEHVRHDLDFLVTQEILFPDTADRCFARLHPTTDLAEALKDVRLIQESGPEHYEAKHKILEQVDRYAPPDAIFASSTSGLLITEIARGTRYPERCVGAHPYNPPHLIPLVELTRGEQTSEECLQWAYQFYQSLHKEPIILQKECLGFISNRLQLALSREGADLIMRGVCTVEDIDKAVTYGPGLRWAFLGPYLLMELASSQGGFVVADEHFRSSAQLWLKDMAKWEAYPDRWSEVAQTQIYDEMAHRPAEQGNNAAEIMEYRDRMLIELLKLHKKLHQRSR